MAEWELLARRSPISALALLGLVAMASIGCGTVLPPLDEEDGATPTEDGAPGDDVEEDTAPPGDDDAGVDDGSRPDVSVDASVDASADVCRGCDVRSDGDAARSDVADAPRDLGDARIADAADVRDGDGNPCPTPVDCTLAACNGASCGANGRVCSASACTCPGGQTKETTCGDGKDNDCDGQTDCADPDCARLQCGTSTNQRCCGTTCVNTETDSAHCQGCGLACASGQTCKRITDESGTRGHCTCAGTTSQCPKSPNQVCRTGNGDGQDNLCACDVDNTGNAGCAEGQVCQSVAKANFCHY
ncbi:MAG: hypothetical protein ABW133_17905 [Polyangiaceae bacterium]